MLKYAQAGCELGGALVRCEHVFVRVAGLRLCLRDLQLNARDLHPPGSFHWQGSSDTRYIWFTLVYYT